MPFTPGPLQTAWLDALKSGKYKQTKEVLFSSMEDAYCCLGVACIIAGLLPIRVGDTDYTRFEDQENVLPESIVEKMSFRGTGGEKRNTLDSSEALYRLNDQGVSFVEIAKIVEADPEQYFSSPA